MKKKERKKETVSWRPALQRAYKKKKKKEKKKEKKENPNFSLNLHILPLTLPKGIQGSISTDILPSCPP